MSSRHLVDDGQVEGGQLGGPPVTGRVGTRAWGGLLTSRGGGVSSRHLVDDGQVEGGQLGGPPVTGRVGTRAWGGCSPAEVGCVITPSC